MSKKKLKNVLPYLLSLAYFDFGDVISLKIEYLTPLFIVWRLLQNES